MKPEYLNSFKSYRRLNRQLTKPHNGKTAPRPSYRCPSPLVIPIFNRTSPTLFWLTPPVYTGVGRFKKSRYPHEASYFQEATLAPYFQRITLAPRVHLRSMKLIDRLPAS